MVEEFFGEENCGDCQSAADLSGFVVYPLLR